MFYGQTYRMQHCPGMSGKLAYLWFTIHCNILGFNCLFLIIVFLPLIIYYIILYP